MIAVGLVIARVAPLEGAWIEITCVPGRCYSQWSHPLRVRGLKFNHDWTRDLGSTVAPLEGAWIEIALAPSDLDGALLSRTP